MKALICAEYGLPETLEFKDISSPEIGPHQVLIQVHAAGANFPDGLIIQNKYQIKPDLPFTPGGEVSGVVIGVGDEVTGIEVGQRVLAPLGGYGGFAEEALAEDWRVLPIPSTMDYDTAAVFSITYGTSYHALKQRGQVKPGESLLVLGAAGGVGLAAVELGKAMGARVIAAASSEEKLELPREHGADYFINYGTGDLRAKLKEIVGDAGVDVVYDPVGGSLTEAALRSTGWNGRYLVIGFAAGEVPKIPLNLPLLKGNSIVGVFWGSFCRKFPEENLQNSRELFAMHAEGKINPSISARYPLEKAADAIDLVLARGAKGKVVVEVNHD